MLFIISRRCFFITGSLCVLLPAGSNAVVQKRQHICRFTLLHLRDGVVRPVHLCMYAGHIEHTAIPVHPAAVYFHSDRVRERHRCAPGFLPGKTLCDPEHIEPLPFIKIDEPTISMNFIVNDSPFAGKEGKFVTSRNIRDRLFKEVETNVSMRVEETETTDTFKVSGRGELHLSILIETMRRQNYEFQVSRPEVITKTIDGKLHEPMEYLIVEVPDSYVGAVMEKLGSRKAELINMGTRDGGVTHIEFRIPARGLMGYRPEFLTDTNGNGIMNHVFDGYEPWKGEIVTRHQGSLIAFETGETVTYGLYAAQERGRLFIGAGVPVYEGMIVGVSPKSEDITVNVCKKKHITNTRASGSDDALKLTPPTIMSLEQCLEFVEDDELCEVTPQSIRLRKKILSNDLRAKTMAKLKNKDA